MRRAALLFVVTFIIMLGGCKPTPESLRKSLASSNPAERQKAATALQAMYAKDPLSVGDHGAQYWTERLEQARGEKTPEVVKILGGAKITGGEAGGGGENVTAHLDDFWVASLGRSTRGDDTVFSTEKPRRFVQHVDVAPPKDFTGTWLTYYVHGATYESIDMRGGTYQKKRELYEGGQVRTEWTYVDDKVDGIVVTRSPSGVIEREVTYSKGQSLSERELFPSGRVKHETTYKDGNLDRSRSFTESGTVTSCQVFRNGIPAPCPSE